MYSYSRNTHGISIFVLEISVVYQEKYFIGVTPWVFRLLKDKSYHLFILQGIPWQTDFTSYERRRTECSASQSLV